MATKDWKRMGSSREPQWLNTSKTKHRMLQIEERQDIFEGKNFIISINGKRIRMLKNGTKSQALKYAKAYMRTH